MMELFPDSMSAFLCGMAVFAAMDELTRHGRNTLFWIWVILAACNAIGWAY